MTMSRKILALFLSLCLCFSTTACTTSNTSTGGTKASFVDNTNIPKNNIPDGQYEVLQASFDDLDGQYTLMLLNTPPGSNSVYRTNNLRMARLTDEQIQKGQKTYVEIRGDEATMYLTPDFKIEYIHNETQTVTNPETGKQETVIVRQQSGFWAPFAGALAGQMLGNLLFTPQYYIPPAYSPGVPLTGFGGYGSTYDMAVERYRSQYNSIPLVEKNRQVFRTAGTIKNSPGSGITRVRPDGTKATGSGFGASNLKTSGSSSRLRQPSSSSFGSSRSGAYRVTPRRSGGFGSRRR